MAVTKCKALHGRLDSAITYIMNVDKTMYGDLIYGYECSGEYAAHQMQVVFDLYKKSNSVRTGYHLIQSFDPEDNITPEKAFEIGKEFASRVLGTDTQYILSTHVDKDHVHNHIIFNSVPFAGDHKMYRWTQNERRRIEQISDELCRENGFCVIEEKSGERGKTNYKDGRVNNALNTLRSSIDKAVEHSSNINEFVDYLQNEYGIETRIGKTITFTLHSDDFENGIFRCRDRKLGSAYSPDALENRMKGIDVPPNLVTKKSRGNEVWYEKRIRKIINVNNNEKALKSKAYANSIYASNASNKIQTLNYVLDLGYRSMEEYLKHIDDISIKRSQNNKIINENKLKADKITEQIKNVKNYRNYKKIFDEFNTISEPKTHDRFLEEHSKELLDYQMASMYFADQKPYKNPYKISLNELYAELKKLKEERSTLYDENQTITSELKESKNVVYNIKKILDINDDIPKNNDVSVMDIDEKTQRENKEIKNKNSIIE